MNVNEFLNKFKNGELANVSKYHKDTVCVDGEIMRDYMLCAYIDGVFYICIQKASRHICATRQHGKHSYEIWYSSLLREFSDKDKANAYFKKCNFQKGWE